VQRARRRGARTQGAGARDVSGSSEDLIQLSACEVADRLHRGELRPADLVEASIARIEATDAAVNALPVRCYDRARAQADALRRSGRSTVLGGIPIVVKDNNDVGGVGTSGGTALFRDRVPAVSDRTIAHLETNGAIPIAKANLSELGGANTTNRLFGPTRHPMNTALTCGGSSGGSTVAVATGQVWLAHGNDVGGSLRIPPAFCGITGLRPTPGRIARKVMSDPSDTVFVDGPIARGIEDLALMFDAMVGFDAGDPLSAPSPDAPFRAAARAPRRPARVAFTTRLADFPVEDEIAAVCEQAVLRLAAAGVQVHHAAPDTRGALDAIKAIRGDAYAMNWEPLLSQHKGAFTTDVQRDIQRGLTQRPEALRAARRYRIELTRRTLAFLAETDFLICPATQAMPFPVEQPYVTRIGDTVLDDYIDWIGIDYVWSLVGCPVLALPAGRARDGLLVGLQVMARPRAEASLLAFGAWMEREFGGPARPVTPPDR
jgi:amidase